MSTQNEIQPTADEVPVERRGRPHTFTAEQRAVLAFLYGAGSLRGADYGGLPEGETRPFWWRSELSAAFPELRVGWVDG